MHLKRERIRIELQSYLVQFSFRKNRILKAERNKSNLFTLAAGTGVSADGTLLVCANLPTRAGRKASPALRGAWRVGGAGGGGKVPT